MRKIGVDLNLQERLDEMFAKEQSEEVTNAVDIGFPVGKLSKYQSWFAVINGKKSPNQETGFGGQKGNLQVINDTKLVVNEYE